MGGRRDYRRWDYDDETEITMEEQLTMEDNASLGASTETLGNSTFPPAHILSTNSPARCRESSKRKISMKEKTQLCAVSVGILLLGFMMGFGIGVRERGPRHSKHFSPMSDQTSHEHNDLIFHELQQISAHNIRSHLKTMTKEEHRSGTKEGHEMATAIRDLWRSYGISVRIEQHKTLLTKTESFNFVQVINKNGSVSFTTSKIGDEANLLNSQPIMAFSPAADFNGTLFFGNYGRWEDFLSLEKFKVDLDGSICLVRFGTLHPSDVAANAIQFGVKGLIFYPDPQDFGPDLPTTAVKISSLLTVGQIHDYQKKKGNWIIPSHTISAKDAEQLMRTMVGSEKVPSGWEGGLGNTTYYIGGMKAEGGGLIRLKIFNEAKHSMIYNVIGSIPGVESDRYIILGCSHDSWAGSGAADPGIGLAMTTELLRAFSSAISDGWKPRRSILIISWDANLFASSGVSHWLQEHHFEIATRTVAYIDMTRTLKGNQTLEVFSSPLLKEVARKAINKIKYSSATHSQKSPIDFSNVLWKSVVSKDEPAFTFLGNLGIPTLRFCLTNIPQAYNYPLFHTEFDTFDNFVQLVDSNFERSEALGRIIAESMVLLADSPALPITLHDYMKDIRKEFDHFMAEYHDDFQKSNLSYVSLQAAVMRLEVTVDNFKSHTKNHTKENNNLIMSHHRKFRREIQHRILNDKLILVEKALLTRNSDTNDGYKHQVIGYTASSIMPEIPHLRNSSRGAVEESSQAESHLANKSNFPRNRAKRSVIGNGRKSSHKVFSSEHFPISLHLFPKLGAVLECGRSCGGEVSYGDACLDLFPPTTTSGFPGESNNVTLNIGKRKSSSRKNNCMDWPNVASQRISSLVRSLDYVVDIIQSPLVVAQNPE